MSGLHLRKDAVWGWFLQEDVWMNKTKESLLETGPSLAECIAVIWILNVFLKSSCVCWKVEEPLGSRAQWESPIRSLRGALEGDIEILAPLSLHPSWHEWAALSTLCSQHNGLFGHRPPNQQSLLTMNWDFWNSEPKHPFLLFVQQHTWVFCHSDHKFPNHSYSSLLLA